MNSASGDARKSAAPAMSVAGLPGPEVAELSARFEKELWPRLQEACLPCHGQKNASQFLLPGDARTAFLKMLGEGQFDPDNHASASARVATTDQALVMPPPSMGMTLKPEEVALFTKFSEDVQKRRAAHGGKPESDKHDTQPRFWVRAEYRL